MLKLLRKNYPHKQVLLFKRFVRRRPSNFVDVVSDKVPVLEDVEPTKPEVEATPTVQKNPPVKLINPLSQLSESELLEKLSDVVTPLWRVPYEEQLEIKWKKNEKVLSDLSKLLRNKKNVSKPLCQLDSVIPSPAVNSYRNKDEFHVRYDGHGKVVCGMFIGQAKNNTLICVKPDKLLNIHEKHMEAAQVFQDYVSRSDWKVCEHFKKGGNWRQLTVRTNNQGDMMATSLIHPQNLSSDQIHEEMCKFKEFFIRNLDSVKSLYYQACPHTRCNSEQAPFVLLHGDSHIYETIDQFRFRLSPESFFQVNTPAAGVLYSTARKLLKPTRMTTVLDLCCGIGTQGLMVADQARGVVGIELSAEAVRDAKFNAALNNIDNAEFYAGSVQQLLKPVLEELTLSPDIAAILNPARSGVQARVIRQLRENDRIHRIVYISCHPEAAMANFADLMKKNSSWIGEPFRLKRAVPVDMFPHTEHCELVLLFQR